MNEIIDVLKTENLKDTEISKEEDRWIKREIGEITEEWELRINFKKKFGKTLNESMIPLRYGNKHLKTEEIEGIGDILYFEEKYGDHAKQKMIKEIKQELKERKIKYEIPENEEADLTIQRYKINVITASNPSADREERKKIARKCREDQENTILIFITRKSKKLFARSNIKEGMRKANRFFTLPEFINKIENLIEYPEEDKKGMIPRITRELENMNIQYEKPKNREADLRIQKYKINVITMEKPPKENRKIEEQARKCREDPENTILIFRNLGSRRRFMESKLSEIITRKYRFFTIEGFIKWIKKEVKE